ncbi:MAG: hypothetical protein LQ343_003974 [Gyalolechia ehrenbergii]|nr:MAG: hypothetical protein LQ343_003974 [Gyalolechia ehrenbergii]
MVVLLDLDDDDAFDPFARPAGRSGLQTPFQINQDPVTNDPEDVDCCNDNGMGKREKDRPNPNINGFSAALGCYPIVTLLTRNLDLNTLHALSRTCRQFRANLLQYRPQLIHQTLRCSNESFPSSGSQLDFATFRNKTNALVSGRVGPCARDMVSDCRRCGKVICRNCAHKSPSPSRLWSRHRRLCPTCLATPLPQLSRHWQDPCTCTSSVYLCGPCGTGLTVADTNYRRIWTWRTRYSTYLGGLGTGIGEGNEGVKCWRGEKCMAAQEVEVEIDCSEEGRGSSDRESSESDSEWHWAEGEGKQERAGYWQQEIEGIGGVVKKKLRKRVRVGKTVKEWEDERDGKEEVLARESRGEARSWCGWCGRLVWGKKDRETFRTTQKLEV